MVATAPAAVDYPVIGMQCFQNVTIVMSCKNATSITESRRGHWQVCHQAVLWSPQDLTWVYRFKDVHVPFTDAMNTLQASTNRESIPVLQWLMFPIFKNYVYGDDASNKVSFILVTMEGTRQIHGYHPADVSPIPWLPNTTFIEAGKSFMNTVGSCLLSSDSVIPFKTVMFRLDEDFPFAVTSPFPFTVCQLPLWGYASSSELGQKWKPKLYHDFGMRWYAVLAVVVGGVLLVVLIGLGVWHFGRPRQEQETLAQLLPN
eukprot:TRINITY_DN85185_c0_g1_i1.p1 TRINITY_DN85185_c0_g1~~TRINITY_DN85185_c0_g1_i1.p1  ORF type:complete len:266 (-),score=34.06 TRINITY_DN85185_c0_g1_i1:18-794(-)